MGRELHDFPGGLKIPTHKELTSAKPSLITPLPDLIILPLQQHIGTAAEPVIGIGDKVRKGQIVARAEGYVSVPVHASTSGRIIDIGDYSVPDSFGLKAPCIVIEPDGDDAWFEITPVADFVSVDPQKLQEVIREAGIVGLGGAGFPAHVKLREGTENAVDTLIINGVECEPYITCDDRLIREKPEYIIAGARMIRHAVQAKHCVIALEADMPEAHAALAKLIDDDIELISLPVKYPQGGERQLIKVLTGKEVPSGGLPIHIGIVMHNVGTAAAAYRAVRRGEPLISRYVTVSGDLPDPRNLQVLLGTPVRHCADQCGYREQSGEAIILGGPMMGMHVTNMHMPVIKTTNCVLVTATINYKPEQPCIRCGLCVDVCPAELMPQELFRHARARNYARLREYHLFDCIECGCCSYVCPSNIRLVHYYRKAKREIMQEEKTARGATDARRRFVARTARLAREVEEQDQKKKSSSQKMTDDKQDFIEAAVARTRAKREQMKNTLDRSDKDE
jgi:electron transport complex protein RnfC